MAGKRLNTPGDVEPAGAKVASALLEKMAEPRGQFYARWARWFLADRRVQFDP